MSLCARLAPFAVLAGVLWPGTCGFAQEFVEQLSPGEQKITAALGQPARVDFADVPLFDVLAYLGDFHDVDIRLDAAAVTERGVTPESPVSVRANDVPLARCLDLLLQRFGLSYTVYDGNVLLVTTPARARRWMPQVRFSLASFAQGSGQEGLAPEQAATLTAAIRACIDPGGWGEAEGQSSLIALPRTRPHSLMVTAPLAAQEEIAAVMAGLDPLAKPETPDKWTRGTTSGVEKSFIARVYPLTGPAEPLIERITASVDPTSWHVVGGPGAIAAVELGPVQALVIRQTCENQEQIAKLLEK